MNEIEYRGKKIPVDDDGFLLNSDEWDEGLAMALAKNAGIDELNDEKIEILKFMRGYYKKFNAFPIMNYVCKNIHQPKECINDEFINPEAAWKIAGLPKLSGVHFVSVDGKNYLLEECC